MTSWEFIQANGMTYEDLYNYMQENDINGFKSGFADNRTGENIDTKKLHESLKYDESLLDKFYKSMTNIKDSQDRFIDSYIKPVYSNLTYGLIALACGFAYYKLFYKKGVK